MTPNDTVQNRLDFDDAQSVAERGLQVVSAQFLSVEPFTKNIFEGFDEMRALTYSVSTPMIVRMLDRYSFQRFECVFGYEGGLGRFATVIAFQQFLKNQVRECALQLEDESQRIVLEKIHGGTAQFYVVKDNIAHSKLYLLKSADPERRRVIVGSANLSERAFGGKQAETLLVFDDDDKAWEHYSREYEAVKETASDRIDLPVDLRSAEIAFTDTPVLQDPGVTVFLPPPIDELTVPQVVHKVEELAVPVDRVVSPLVSRENGRYILTPAVKAEIKKMRWRKGQQEDDETRPTHLTIHQESRYVSLSGIPFSLDADDEGLRRSAGAIVEYFNNYELGFVGDVRRLQRDYFMFMSWLYASPFICDLRARAVVGGGNIFHYPSFAVIYGKSNCGKTSLVDTLITSMFGHPSTVDKDSFTRGMLRGLQQNYGRYPVVFDDINRRRFNNHGLDIVKDENLPPVQEHPCFVVSMNAEPQSFQDEVVKRCLMIYANTSLPTHDYALADELHSSVEKIRDKLTTDFYRRYLAAVMEKLDADSMPGDILRMSSDTICEVLDEFVDGELPDWCRPVTWSEYAGSRYVRAARRLSALLAPENYRDVVDGEQGWTLRADTVVVWEKADAFGRTSIKGEIPDFLYDDTSSVGDTFVLWRKQTEEFLNKPISAPGFKWWPWRR
ncbi:MAG: phospholipase D-like domain-containing protein [Chloroflexi bacterium]|nr:phospholipase D-like domain-containing protein [Chloroflexota bacterium]